MKGHPMAAEQNNAAERAANYTPEDREFYDFWYGHMLGDVMQAPLADVAHSTARYIWDAARRSAAIGEGNSVEFDGIKTPEFEGIEASASIDEDGLPPRAGMIDFIDEFGRLTHKDGWTADQMRQFASDHAASLQASFDAAVALAGETIDARNEEIADLRAQLARQSQGVSDLRPIEYDKGMDRVYIPLPGGWEIQTKGNGSTFRIAHVPSRQRWHVLDDRLHEPLEGLAREMRNHYADLHAQFEPGSEKPVAWKYRALAGNGEWRVTLNEEWARSVNGDVDVVPLYAAPPLYSEQQATPACRNCLDFGWEPSVGGERRPCGFCQKPGEQNTAKCVGCEGKPSAENNPCAVCGKAVKEQPNVG
jgi:hypothetical protein